jgi:hypothetical protein
MTFQKGNQYGKMTKGKSHVAWNKGFKKETDERIKKCGFKNNHKIFKGCEKGFFTSEKMKGNTFGFKKGFKPWNKDMKKDELIEYYKNGWNTFKHNKGKEHWNWNGGISKQLYPDEWKESLKNIIRKRDNYTCQICKIKQNNLIGRNKRLDVHHINKNKNDLNLNNLISLCRSCHIKVHRGKIKCE